MKQGISIERTYDLHDRLIVRILNAVAVTAFLLDGPETLLRHIGLDERDTYTTKHEIDDLVTVVHITRLEGGGTA